MPKRATTTKTVPCKLHGVVNKQSKEAPTYNVGSKGGIYTKRRSGGASKSSKIYHRLEEVPMNAKVVAAGRSAGAKEAAAAIKSELKTRRHHAKRHGGDRRGHDGGAWRGGGGPGYYGPGYGYGPLPLVVLNDDNSDSDSDS